VQRAAGMVRFMLPDSGVNPIKAHQRPTMFADTAIPLLVESLLALGCERDDLVVKAAGGGGLSAGGGIIDIGRRNCEALKQVCSNLALEISAQDTGGTASRSVLLEVGSGKVTVTAQGKESEL